VLDGLALVLDAGGLEDLFGGPDDEAAFLFDLLRETARGRPSAHYWEICRTARNHRVTPEYVIDRAALLLASIEERRRADLYRVLGAPPLSSPETLRQRYLELAKTAHPDVGGDPQRFRHVKEAYEILRDPERRAEYERFWVRALGPFERVVPDEGGEAVGAVMTRPAQAPSRDVRMDTLEPHAGERHDVDGAEARDGARPQAAIAAAASGVLAARADLDRRVGPVGSSDVGGVAALLTQIEAALATVSREHIEQAQAEIARSIADLERVRARLELVAHLQRQVAKLVAG
jgi:curved DNA-binding protein CbpA